MTKIRFARFPDKGPVMNWESRFRPWYLVRRMVYKIHELRHPDEPWLPQGAIDFCSRILTREAERS